MVELSSDVIGLDATGTMSLDDLVCSWPATQAQAHVM